MSKVNPTARLFLGRVAHIWLSRPASSGLAAVGWHGEQEHGLG